ncbi:ComEC/Rec2 family competence protein [Actinopolyspora saharensis]|uniref:Competence protein ComEC n=1 Tax=Actinopolyspora saharensis TaxID=995062 RepID=A0A1H1DGI6_9ACTN|nr:ComEC/Rec2 family competence protein [Actinopolyspora saharensis]SDQ75651.1 competence protein ComEC [Actinopolyspora saharensis]
MTTRAVATAPNAGKATPPSADMRLVPAAAGTWAVTLVCLCTGWQVASGVACAGCLATVALAFLRGRRVNGAVVLVVLGAATAFCLVPRLHHVETHELRAAELHGESVGVRVELTRRPRPTDADPASGRGAGERSVVRAELRALRKGGEWHPIGGRALLLVPTSSWADSLPGRRVRTTAVVVPPHGAGLLATVLVVHQPPEELRAAPPVQRVAEDLRAGLREVCSRVLGSEAAGLLPGLVIGDTGALPATVREEFRKAGLTHLTAVSGANLAIVCGAALALLRLVRAPRPLAAAGAGCALLGFVVLAGGEPSVLRAAVMGGIGLLALVLGRGRATLPALAASVIVLLLVDPELAIRPGFALSVTATAALVLIAPGWSTALRGRGVPRGLAEALAVPAAAQLATGPVVVALSGEFSLVGVLANILAEPVVAPATVLGVAATLAAGIPRLGELLVWAAAPELEWILLVARRAADVPLATVPLPAGVFGAVLLAACAGLVLLGARFRATRRWTVLGACLALVVVLIVPAAVRPPWPPGGSWSLVACDVGQGDALVLATGVRDTAVVVDTGPSAALVGECLDRLGVERVPLLVLTHPHADHFAGIAGVADGRRLGRVALGGACRGAWRGTGVRARIAEAGAREVRLAAGQRLGWPGLVLEVLAPAAGGCRAVGERVNDASAVLKATTPAGRVLLTGDIELAAQRRLLGSGERLRAEVLKVPHHGSRYTSEEFLRAVSPELALISVGHGNDYGHPSAAIVATLRSSGALVRRTDRRGDIAVLGDPGRLRVVGSGNPLRPEE